MAIDILSAFSQTPPPQDFIFQGFLAGSVGALVSPGATGKSFLTLEAAMAVAGGTDLLGFNPLTFGKVRYFAGEDPESEVIRRVHAIGAHLGEEARQKIAKNLFLEPVCGSRIDIMIASHRDYIIKHNQDTRLIVFDTLSRIHQMDENSNGDMARLVSQLESIAKHTRASVLYLHHTSKAAATGGMGDQQQAARGASALIDNARWCGFVARMTPDEAKKLTDRMDGQPIDDDSRGYYVRFGVSKQNYGIPTADKWLKRAEGGVLLPVDLFPAKKQAKRTGGAFDD